MEEIEAMPLTQTISLTQTEVWDDILFIDRSYLLERECHRVFRIASSFYGRRDNLEPRPYSIMLA